jgi:tRNA-splicing ligase RtcB
LNPPLAINGMQHTLLTGLLLLNRISSNQRQMRQYEMNKAKTSQKTLTDSTKSSNDWKRHARWHQDGYYTLETQDTGDIPVRLFLTEALLSELEDILYKQIINATRFPGTRAVIITPDTHYGYGVPVGCVLITDGQTGSIAMGPVGYDIGCGMMSAASDVRAAKATKDKRLEFNRAVMQRVSMGAGGKSHKLGRLSEKEFNNLVRGGAEYYVDKYGAEFDRSHAERHRIPVDDRWQIPWGGRGRPERGLDQLGSLGGGNHFIELQEDQDSGNLFIQVHTGSRGFGHGLATNFFEMARSERNDAIKDIDLGYFLPESLHYRDYLNAVAAAGNYAIINRLIIFEQVAESFREVFNADLQLIYEISHNLVQREHHPQFGDVWVHRKGATRAFPAGHHALKGTRWESTGHPVLVPGSNKSASFILRPLAGAVKSCYSVNHGAGRRMSRGEALRQLSQEKVDRDYEAAGILVNLDGHVPLDEAAPAYKSSEEVIKAITDAGLAEVQHTLWPLASLKGTETGGRKHKSKARTSHF